MPDRSTLLTAVCANPDDDAPRLAFADWLDANEPDKRPRKGAPSAWAALIRAECELTRLQQDGSAAAAVYEYCARQDDQALSKVRWARALPEMVARVKLHRTAERFRKASAKARAAALPDGAATGIEWSDETHRGFPASVAVTDWDLFAAALPDLSRSCPRVRIEFERGVAPTGPAPELVTWCRGLSLVLAGPEPTDLLISLSQDPAAAGIRELAVHSEDGDECDRALPALADATHLSGVHSFSFRSDFESPIELRDRLFGAPVLRGVTRLTLTNAEAVPSPAVLAALPALRALSLEWGAATDDHLFALAAAPGLAGLRELELGAPATARGLGAVLASPHLRDLVVLQVQSGTFDLDRAALAELPPADLRVASFAKAKSSPATVAALLADGRFPNLLCFDGGYGLPRDAVAEVFAAIEARTPAVLRLQAAEFGAADIKALAKAPGLVNTNVLDLWRVKVTATGAKALAESPHLAALAYFSAAPADKETLEVLRTRFNDPSCVWSTF